jgi:hypothetical protein
VSRPDLLALTPESVTALANAGLVKRALREIGEGAGPTLEETDDGVVHGKFADGAHAKLLPGKTLKESPCTCGAPNVCRHRVAVALAYKAWFEAKHDGGPPPESARLPDVWSPAEITDAQIEKAIGKRLERARQLVKKGVLVTVEPGAVPAAKLPACTVRFLVPRDVAYARCDCAEQGGCEHQAIAIWAFREAGNVTAPTVVSLGGTTTRRSYEDLDAAVALARDVLLAGVAGTLPAANRFAQVRTRAEDGKMLWIASALEELELVLDGYRSRSALYSSAKVLALLTEIEARSRAARAESAELPERFVLGEDEAPETLLDHVRLVSLGARLRADGRSRYADVFLADPDTQTVLVLGKRWDFKEKEAPEEGPVLARRSIASRLSLHQIAHGQLVSKAVKRRANRSMELATSRAVQTSVTPQRGEWGQLPSPILVRDMTAHLESLRARPPAMLRPRVLADDVHVVAVKAVEDVVYLTAEQMVVATLVDEADHPFTATIAHRSVAPHAVDAATTALRGPVRFVAGELRRGRFGMALDVTAIAGEAVVVPDLATAPAAANDPLPRHEARVRADVLGDALRTTFAALEEAVHVGVKSLDEHALRRMAAAAARLEEVGLTTLGKHLSEAHASAKSGDAKAAVRAVLSGALRAQLTQDAR